MSNDNVEFVEAPSEELLEEGAVRYTDVVLHSTDWTTETVVGQLQRGNIVLKPRFQRRDAWDKQRKSRFIESLILGLPIPQIVLAESKSQRGSFIVLDGKQRLLSLLQFWGFGDGENNAYRLSGLEVLKSLAGRSYKDLEAGTEFADDFRALINQPIRTVVIKNWPDHPFLHLVFLRLNTGSVKLSPQELRQAMMPGNFTDYVDDRSIQSQGLKQLLGLERPDYRMRDVELMARHLAFRFSLPSYRGRLKAFLDSTFENLNSEWTKREGEIVEATNQFDLALLSLLSVFGDGVARKPGSPQLNRAVLDALLFFSSDPMIRAAIEANSQEAKKSYVELFEDREFVAAVERDTAGVKNTFTRLHRWGMEVQKFTGLDFALPTIVQDEIKFSGFWA